MIGIALDAKPSWRLLGQAAGRRVLILTVFLTSSIASARAAAPSFPAAKSDLVFWLDAQDVDGDGNASNVPPDGAAVRRWVDKSGRGNHAVQDERQQAPAYAVAPLGWNGNALRFHATGRQYLSVADSESLDLERLTAFVVGRASAQSTSMWLFGKNCFTGSWTGYGIAVERGSTVPWPHLGLGAVGSSGNGYLRFKESIRDRFAVVEISYDGEILRGLLDGSMDRAQAPAGEIRSNERDLLVGASPQNPPAVQFFDGYIAEILLYNRALDAGEREATLGYLAKKYELEVRPRTGDGSQPMIIERGPRLPFLVENAATPITRTLPAREADEALRRDWLFQAMDSPPAERGLEEVGWARELANRLASDPNTPDLSADLRKLDRMEHRLRQQTDKASSEAEARELYFAVRRVKRRIMFANPILDFDQLLFIDQPYPQGGHEWKHQAIHRLGYKAVPGGRLLVLDGLNPGGRLRQLAPEKPGSFWRADVSFDGTRVLFCYKARDEESFHLYEVDLESGNPRQITFGPYDDIDPIYVPGGRIVFTTTRGNTYVRCGPYIHSYVLARCDFDGENLYFISTNSEPDFVPALMPDGRIVYSRWEYTDKDVMRVQSLWTVKPDGTQAAALWGNQSVWPDHTAEPRPIPGGGRVMFAGVGHHDWFSGSIGIIDPTKGFNFPDGLTKVTCDLRWAETSKPPVDLAESNRYHASGRYTGHLGAYPLSEEDFLVSSRGGDGNFRLYLMDVHGNRELIYEGVYNAWYGVPIRTRSEPPRHPDQVTWPGTGEDRRPNEPSVFYSADVYQGVPDLPRGSVKYLRVFQQDAKTYSTWFKTFRLSGPPVSIVQEEAVKRIVSVAPVEPDGSVYFRAPSGKSLYFQLLDEHYRALQTMRSFTWAMPGEQRGCVGCHEMHSTTPPMKQGLALGRSPTDASPPPWGAESIGYERFAQPVLDRYCGECHQGDGEARKDLDLTLRPGMDVFKEPYLTLVGDAVWTQLVAHRERATAVVAESDQPGYGIAAPIPVQTMAGYNDPRGYATLRPMQFLSCRSRLVEVAMSGEHHDVRVDPPALRRLIAWVDANCPYLGEEEIRAMDDPDFPGIDLLPIRPRLRTAPAIDRP